MTDVRAAAVVVLAAGEGTRMRSATPKVLHQMCGRTLLGHVLAATAGLGAEHTLVVVGHGREAVSAQLADDQPAGTEGRRLTPVVQADQRGTGHAVRLALAAVPDLVGAVLVVPGDAPLLTTETLTELLEQHVTRHNAATLLTAEPPDPSGYGRVVRAGGGVTAVVEQRDADEATLAIREVATSVYAFDAAELRGSLDRLGTENSQGEEYLTDVVGILAAAGRPVGALPVADWRETLGVNDRVQLAAARRLLRDRLLRRWMLAGVTVTDPETTWLGVGVTLEPDVTVHQNTQLHGTTRIATGAVVGPNVTLTDCLVDGRAQITNATCEGAVIGPGATVGPYTFLRPGTKLGAGARAGGFVEMKAAELGPEAKVPHLSYVGDATIGARSNIGAATVFVNYDGQEKFRSTVGEDARVGSDTMLVAPVHIGDGAYTAAGSVIVDDVPPGAIGIGRTRQRNVEGWVERRRAGTPAAAAARRARLATRGSEDTPTGTQPPTPPERLGVEPA